MTMTSHRNQTQITEFPSKVYHLVGNQFTAVIAKHLLIASLFLFSAGCAVQTTSQNQPESEASVQKDEQKTTSTSSDKHKKDDKVAAAKNDSEKTSKSEFPDQDLTPDLLYDLMLAEIALQRKEYELAFNKYYEAAKKTKDSRLAKKATRATLFSKNDKQTFKAVKLWSELQPENIDVQQIYASSLINKKKDDEAITYLRRLVTLSDKFSEGFTRAITIIDTVAERDRATKLFEATAKGYEDKLTVKLYRTKLEIKFKDYDAAAKYLKDVLEEQPDHMEGLLLKVELLKKQKQLTEAVQTLKKILNKHPESVPLRLELARLLVEQKLNDQANEQIKLLAKKELSPEVLFAISLLAIEIDELDDGKVYLERLHGFRLYASEAAYFIGQLEASRENYSEAEDWFNRVRHGKYTFDAALGLAVVYSQQKKFKQAFNVLDNSKASTKKENIDILQIKAEVHAQAKNYTKAYEVYTNALKSYPKNHDLLYGRAMVAEKFDRIDLLEKDLHVIIKENPKDSMALNALGYTLADRTDRYEEAYGYIKRALDIDGDDVATLDSMGWVLYKLGREKEALPYLKKAYDKDQDPEIAAHYGEVLWVLGKTDKAREVWKKALKKAPDHNVLVTTTSRYLK
jgi:tetratricopeptide (TPR) repeat protein